MPTYDLKNKDTGEVKEVLMSYDALQIFLKENPEWHQVHLQSNSLIAHTDGIMSKTSGDWRNLLSRIKKGSGRKNTINTY